jgi:nitroreductase
MTVTVVPMEVLDAIKSRRSVRSYSDRAVPEDALTRILESGRIAPSANNRQPWHFVVVTEPERRKALSGGKWAGFLSECPVVIAGCGDKKRSPEWHVVDVTIALQNMVTQATAEGLGTCWIGSFDEATVKKALDVPEHFSVVAMLALGYSADKPRGERKAKPMGEVTSRERFAQSP